MKRSTLPLASWKVGGRLLEPESRGLVMGIVNVTPDSFSDGGRFLDLEAAVEHALQLAAEGADLLDVGGESTRPGADPVSAEEEMRRILPVLERLRDQTDVLLSADTSKAAVAEAALEAGADVINDVTGFRDPAMIAIAAASEAGLVVMHMQGDPGTMQQAPRYDGDVVAEVSAFLGGRLAALQEAGIDPERVVVDPGFGFGKTLVHNRELVLRLPEFRRLGRPLLVGVSRKSMISMLLDDPGIEVRDSPTTALTSALREQGASLFRVHEVRPSVEALRMTEAILGATR